MRQQKPGKRYLERNKNTVLLS